MFQSLCRETLAWEGGRGRGFVAAPTSEPRFGGCLRGSAGGWREVVGGEEDLDRPGAHPEAQTLDSGLERFPQRRPRVPAAGCAC